MGSAIREVEATGVAGGTGAADSTGDAVVATGYGGISPKSYPGAVLRRRHPCSARSFALIPSTLPKMSLMHESKRSKYRTLRTSTAKSTRREKGVSKKNWAGTLAKAIADVPVAEKSNSSSDG